MFQSLQSCSLHVYSPSWFSFISLNDTTENFVPWFSDVRGRTLPLRFLSYHAKNFVANQDTSTQASHLRIKWLPLSPYGSLTGPFHFWSKKCSSCGFPPSLGSLHSFNFLVIDKAKKNNLKGYKKESFLRYLGWTSLWRTSAHTVPFVISKLYTYVRQCKLNWAIWKANCLRCPPVL